MSRQPLVTVLMSVHNGRPYLPAAVDSILGQTLEDFELLVIDDGSTDGSGEYLAALSDPRVSLVRNDENLGLTRSLNRGLDLARGLFVARMDADDVAMPHRLERQVQFLDTNPRVGVVGSSRVLIDETGGFVTVAPAVEDDVGVRWKCLLGNPFAHPAVMFRLDLLDAHSLRYDETYRTAQDYELWSRLLAVTEGANAAAPLLQYRLRDGVSRTHKAEQLANHDRIAHASIRRLVPNFEISEKEVTQLRGRFGGHSVREKGMDPGDTVWVVKYFQLLDAFEAHYGATPPESVLVAPLRKRLSRAA